MWQWRNILKISNINCWNCLVESLNVTNVVKRSRIMSLFLPCHNEILKKNITELKTDQAQKLGLPKSKSQKSEFLSNL